MDMSFASDSMRAVVKGTGPLGQFTATMSRVSVKGPMRLLPMSSQRMVLWSFKVWKCGGMEVCQGADAPAVVVQGKIGKGDGRFLLF